MAPKSNGTTIEANFTIERETKGAVRYEEVNDNGQKLDLAAGAKIGTLYIRKSAFTGPVPKAFKVSIQF